MTHSLRGPSAWVPTQGLGVVSPLSVMPSSELAFQTLESTAVNKAFPFLSMAVTRSLTSVPVQTAYTFGSGV